MTDNEKQVLRRVFDVLDNTENEIAYELAFHSGKLDLCRIDLCKAMDELFEILNADTPENTGDEIPF